MRQPKNQGQPQLAKEVVNVMAGKEGKLRSKNAPSVEQHMGMEQQDGQ